MFAITKCARSINFMKAKLERYKCTSSIRIPIRTSEMYKYLFKLIAPIITKTIWYFILFLTHFGPWRPSSQISHISNTQKCRLQFFWDMRHHVLFPAIWRIIVPLSTWGSSATRTTCQVTQQHIPEELNLQQHWCQHFHLCNHSRDGTFGIEGMWRQDKQSTKRVDMREVFTQALQWEDKQRQKHATRWHRRSYLPFSSTHILKSILLLHHKWIGLPKKNAVPQKSDTW
jgi:hypothetical protein